MSEQLCAGELLSLPAPYYQDDACTIYHGDCREILPTLDRADLLVTDPPYFVPAVAYVGARGKKLPARTLGDSAIMQGYYDSTLPLVAPGPGGSAYVFCDAKSYPVFYRAMFPLFRHVRLLVWDKVVSFNGYTWRHQHELIAWGEAEDARRVPTGDGDVLRERGVLQDGRVHPAQKPVALLQRLIEKHDVAGIVLDPFMGSGSTLVAAKRLNRRAIGIEIEERYCEIAAKRLQQEAAHD